MGRQRYLTPSSPSEGSMWTYCSYPPKKRAFAVCRRAASPTRWAACVHELLHRSSCLRRSHHPRWLRIRARGGASCRHCHVRLLGGKDADGTGTACTRAVGSGAAAGIVVGMPPRAGQHGARRSCHREHSLGRHRAQVCARVRQRERRAYARREAGTRPHRQRSQPDSRPMRTLRRSCVALASI